MTNPVLLSFFAQSDKYREEILNNLKEQGWTPANPMPAGVHLNELFFQIFAALNFQKEYGFSYYDENDTHKVGHIKRHLNKIYFCKADNDVNNKQTPVQNEQYWEVFFDLDKPIYKEFEKYSLATHNHDTAYATLAGDANKNFNVKAGTSDNHAVNKQQMETAISDNKQDIYYEETPLDLSNVWSVNHAGGNGSNWENAFDGDESTETASAGTSGGGNSGYSGIDVKEEKNGICVIDCSIQYVNSSIYAFGGVLDVGVSNPGDSQNGWWDSFNTPEDRRHNSETGWDRHKVVISGNYRYWGLRLTDTSGGAPRVKYHSIRFFEQKIKGVI